MPFNEFKQLENVFASKGVEQIFVKYNDLTGIESINCEFGYTYLLQNNYLKALEYFNKIEDEIPDQLPWVGYLDDAVVVRWVLEDLLADYGKYFKT